jgi:hypothetical protein
MDPAINTKIQVLKLNLSISLKTILCAFDPQDLSPSSTNILRTFFLITHGAVAYNCLCKEMLFLNILVRLTVLNWPFESMPHPPWDNVLSLPSLQVTLCVTCTKFYPFRQCKGKALLFATNLVGIIDDKLILCVMDLIFSEL